MGAHRPQRWHVLLLHASLQAHNRRKEKRGGGGGGGAKVVELHHDVAAAQAVGGVQEGQSSLDYLCWLCHFTMLWSLRIRSHIDACATLMQLEGRSGFRQDHGNAHWPHGGFDTADCHAIQALRQKNLAIGYNS